MRLRKSQSILMTFFCVASCCIIAGSISDAKESSQPKSIIKTSPSRKPSVQPRTLPSTPSGKSTPSIKKDRTGSPVTKVQSGYCCADGKITRSSASTCKRKNGQFFAKQREAQNACDKQTGYCCIQGKLKKETRGKCRSHQGIFSLKQAEAKKVCNATIGYCCRDGLATKMTQALCKQRKGIFFTQQRQATQACERQRGYCCNDDGVHPSDKGSCTRNKGTFYPQQSLAQRACQNRLGDCLVKSNLLTNKTKADCSRVRGIFRPSPLQISMAKNKYQKDDSFSPKGVKIPSANSATANAFPTAAQTAAKSTLTQPNNKSRYRFGPSTQIQENNLRNVDQSSLDSRIQGHAFPERGFDSRTSAIGLTRNDTQRIITGSALDESGRNSRLPPGATVGKGFAEGSTGSNRQAVSQSSSGTSSAGSMYGEDSVGGLAEGHDFGNNNNDMPSGIQAGRGNKASATGSNKSGDGMISRAQAGTIVNKVLGGTGEEGVSSGSGETMMSRDQADTIANTILGGTGEEGSGADSGDSDESMMTRDQADTIANKILGGTDEEGSSADSGDSGDSMITRDQADTIVNNILGGTDEEENTADANEPDVTGEANQNESSQDQEEVTDNDETDDDTDSLESNSSSDGTGGRSVDGMDDDDGNPSYLNQDKAKGHPAAGPTIRFAPGEEPDDQGQINPDQVKNKGASGNPTIRFVDGEEPATGQVDYRRIEAASGGQTIRTVEGALPENVDFENLSEEAKRNIQQGGQGPSIK